MSHYDYTNINKKITELTDICKKNYNINPELYNKYEVKRGLRDITGKGVIAGNGYKRSSFNGDSWRQEVPCVGKLFIVELMSRK